MPALKIIEAEEKGPSKARTMKLELEFDLDHPPSPKEVADLYLAQMVARLGGNITRVAKILRTGRTTIYRRRSAGAIGVKGAGGT